MSVTAEAFAQFESLNDLKNRPTNWQGAVAAAMDGQLKIRDADKLLCHCASIADEAFRDYCKKNPVPKGKIDMRPCWGFTLASCWRNVLSNGRKLGSKCPENARADLIQMGCVADWWLKQPAAHLPKFDSFADMSNPPTTWAQAMAALIAGAVDYDEIGDLIVACAAVADQWSKRECDGGCGYGSAVLIDALCDVAEGTTTEIEESRPDCASSLRAMGHQADLAAAEDEVAR